MIDITFACVAYNNPFNDIQNMIKSVDNVMQYASYYSYEIVIQDNSSSDMGYSNLEGNNVKVVSSKGVNFGYCGGNNKIVQESESNYIIIINPDITISNSLVIDWLIGSVKLKKGICGTLVGTEEWYTYASSFPTDKKYKPEELPFFYNQPTLVKPGNWRSFKYIDGCLMAFSRDTFDKIGGFDENIHPGYFGENVLAFKAFLKGYSIHSVKIDGLFKHSSISNHKKDDEKIVEWTKKSREYFYVNYALNNWDKFIEYLNT